MQIPVRPVGSSFPCFPYLTAWLPALWSLAPTLDIGTIASCIHCIYLFLVFIYCIVFIFSGGSVSLNKHWLVQSGWIFVFNFYYYQKCYDEHLCLCFLEHLCKNSFTKYITVSTYCWIVGYSNAQLYKIMPNSTSEWLCQYIFTLALFKSSFDSSLQ